MKSQTLPVVANRSVGLIKKGLDKYTDKIPGSINICDIQKIALLGTGHTSW